MAVIRFQYTHSILSLCLLPWVWINLTPLHTFSSKQHVTTRLFNYRSVHMFGKHVFQDFKCRRLYCAYCYLCRIWEVCFCSQVIEEINKSKVLSVCVYVCSKEMLYVFRSALVWVFYGRLGFVVVCLLQSVL